MLAAVTDLITNTFIVFFVVIDPVGLAPMFGALTQGSGRVYQRRMAMRGIFLAMGILLMFSLTGQFLFVALGISLDAFRIAGGVLLFLLSIDMIFARQSGLRSTTSSEQSEAVQRQDISVFPLAIPLIAGPGAVTTVLLLMGEQSGNVQAQSIILGILVVVLLITLLVLLFSDRIMRLIGETGANVISRVLGVVLTNVAKRGANLRRSPLGAARRPDAGSRAPSRRA